MVNRAGFVLCVETVHRGFIMECKAVRDVKVSLKELYRNSSNMHVWKTNLARLIKTTESDVNIAGFKSVWHLGC